MRQTTIDSEQTLMSSAWPQTDSQQLMLRLRMGTRGTGVDNQPPADQAEGMDVDVK